MAAWCILDRFGRGGLVIECNGQRQRAQVSDHAYRRVGRTARGPLRDTPERFLTRQLNGHGARLIETTQRRKAAGMRLDQRRCIGPPRHFEHELHAGNSTQRNMPGMINRRSTQRAATTITDTSARYTPAASM